MTSSVLVSPSFRKLLAAVTLSGVGAEVSAVALPLVALLTLDATPLEIGILAALAYLPVVFVTPFAGVLADKYPPRLVNGLADLGRGVFVLSIPLLAFSGALTIPLLCGIAFGIGVIEAMASVAHHSILPAVVSPAQFEKGNSALSGSYSITEVAGPGLGGVLVQIFGPAATLLVDSVSFIASGFLLLRMKTLNAHVDKTGSDNWFVLVGWGFRFLVREPRLLWLGICGGVSNVLLFAFTTVLSIFLIDELSLEPWTFGAVLALGAIGGIGGAVVASKVRDRMSLANTLLAAEMLGGVGVGIVALASLWESSAISFATAALGMLLYSAAMGIYNVHSMSTRQVLAPSEYLGRVTASYRLLSHGAIPVGAVLGGFVAGVWGSATVIAGAGILLVLWAFCLRFTPFMALDSVKRG